MAKNFKEFKNKLNQREKKILESIKEEKEEEAREEAKNEFINKMQRNERHDAIVGKIALTFFPGSELNEETGYEFITYEPLFEVASIDGGNKIPDILIASEKEKSIFTIEVKTRDANKPIRKIKKVKKTFNEYKSRLNEFLAEDVENFSNSYVLVVDDFFRATQLADDCHDENISLWIFEDDMVKLHSGSTTHNIELDEAFSDGYQVEVGNSVYYTPSSPSYIIAKNVLMDIFQKNMSEGKESPKIFSKEEFLTMFLNSTYFSSGEIDKDSEIYKTLVRKVEDVLKDSEKMGVISQEDLPEGSYKIYTRGKTDEEPIIKGIERKWQNEYIENNYKTIAEKNSIAFFEKKRRKEPSLEEYM
ncbi:MAG: hypothetical protein R6U61_09065 [Thermoplasmata archaeon]